VEDSAIMEPTAPPFIAESKGPEYPVDPPQECDFVMKGGITSGVVYPPSILRLQKQFRFRCIGGTSAGAIAAAVTAAAELTRESGGFARLEEIRTQLSEPSRLLDLFTPQALARPLMKVLIETALEGRPQPDAPPESRWKSFWRRLGRARAAFEKHLPDTVGRGAGRGAAIGLAAALLLLVPGAFWLLIRQAAAETWWRLAELAAITGAIGAGLGVLLGQVLAPVVELVQTALRLPREGFFGLCVGYEGERKTEVLTTWLANAMDFIAGRGHHWQGDPLTFSELREKTLPDGRDVSIELRMVTSNLSFREPYVLPFDDRYTFLFCEQEMRRFFPARVVEYLKREALPTELPLPEGYHFFPRRDKLPVVVATRMSLSFPILLSAVPLYTIPARSFVEMRKAQDQEEPFRFQADRHFQKIWFSDGGISSNFPIHFFDAWSPQRPTFGINLMDLPEKEKDNGAISLGSIGSVALGTADRDMPPPTIEDVYLPQANETRIFGEWNPVTDFPSFIAAIFNTARNHRETLQTRLPSYRERIAQVRLTAQEGGLNLTMKPETIRQIENKGTRAGDLLLEMNFEQHQWVRLRVLMAELEKGLFQIGEAFQDRDDFVRLFEKADEQGWYRSDKWNPRDRAEAADRMEALLGLLRAWQASPSGPEFFRKDRPKPEPILRVTPPF
jgi:predicted acylesterase/phospholipase RssA